MNCFDYRLDDLIFPLFVYESENAYEQSLKSGQMNKSKVYKDRFEDLLEELIDLGVSQILLFGVPKKRNENGDLSSAKHGVIQKSIRKIRKNFGNNFRIFSDVCLCQYNTSGHCGIFANNTGKKDIKGDSPTNEIDNDKTLVALGRVSLSLCESGTDFIAPSAMMDGQVLYLRKLLNYHGFEHVKILSYSAKHNSCLYSPFRTNNYLKYGFIDKSSYQCSFYNKHESLREILIDIEEGSDWVMIKPSLWYMDIIRNAREIINVPIVVQNVSGEYALLKSVMNLDFVTQAHFDDNNELMRNPLLIKGHLGSNQKTMFRSKENRQIQKLPNVKRMATNDHSDSVGNENSSYNIDRIANFILLLKRAGADKIITYFLLDLLIRKGIGKRTV